jgi:hypothetical protein
MTSLMASFMRKTACTGGPPWPPLNGTRAIGRRDGHGGPVQVVRLITAVLVVTAAAIPTHSFNLTVGVPRSLLDAVATSRAHSGTITRADYAISKVDSGIVKAFEKAWRRSAAGTSSLEGVVLILRMADGSFSGREMGWTNEYRSFTFPWHPAAIAIVHTHPNASDPQPCGADLVAADKYRVPIFTITSRGMFVYDPGTRKITKVMNNLDWLDQSRWSNAVLGKR